MKSLFKNKEFEFKAEHLFLLKRMSVGWNDCEFGAPEINPKRPYGNSDVLQDLAEMLGVTIVGEGIYEVELFGEKYRLTGDDEYNLDFDSNPELYNSLNKLHKETEIALRIFLDNAVIQQGVYVSDWAGHDWKLREDQKE